MSKPKNLSVRIKRLLSLGIKLTQVAEVSGVSYTSLHRFIYAKDIALTDDTQVKINGNLDKWVKSVGAA